MRLSATFLVSIKLKILIVYQSIVFTSIYFSSVFNKVWTSSYQKATYRKQRSGEKVINLINCLDYYTLYGNNCRHYVAQI